MGCKSILPLCVCGDSLCTIPYGYCHCGCGRRTTFPKKTSRARGCIRGLPYRYVHGHARRQSPVEYLVEDCGYLTPCWVWQLHINESGYGVRSWPGKPGRMGLAHRWYYEQRYGPILANLVPDHLCRVRACVNPEHLEAVTLGENNRRGAATKLTIDSVMEIRLAIQRGATQRALAAQYGVSQTAIGYISIGRNWRGMDS